jgi:hypothetical protein
MSICDNPNHSTGLFNISTGDFFPDCGCNDEVVIPVGAILSTLPKARRLQIAARIFPNEFGAAKRAALAGKLAKEVAEQSRVQGLLAALRTSLTAVSNKVVDLADDIDAVLFSQRDVKLAKEALILKGYELLNTLKFVRDRNEIPPNPALVTVGDPWWDIYDLIPTQYGLPGPDKIILNGDRLAGGTLYQELLAKTQQSQALTATLPNLMQRRSTAIYEEAVIKANIARNEEKLGNIATRIQDVEDVQNGMKNIEDLADVMTDLAGFCLNILSVLTVVQSHQCSDPSMLNPDTCKCDKCPPDKDICKNHRQDFYLPRAPRPLPGSAMADELNYCTPRCCGGRQNLWYENTFTFGGSCRCECPNIGGTWWPVGRFPDMMFSGWDPVGEEQDFRQCENPPCGGKCGKRYPPDHPRNPSYYEWSTKTCEWECQPVSKPACYDNKIPSKPYCPDGWDLQDNSESIGPDGMKNGAPSQCICNNCSCLEYECSLTTTTTSAPN